MEHALSVAIPEMTGQVYDANKLETIGHGQNATMISTGGGHTGSATKPKEEGNTG